jgi:tetratricopeptide (TPR) repeat protein
MHIFELLSQLITEFSEEKLEESITFIRQDLIREIEEGEIDGHSIHMILNDQQDPFFEALATEFVADIIATPFTYFSLWEPLLAYLDRRSIQLFYTAAVKQAGITEAFALCMGFWELENEQPKEAITHFFNATNELRHYGIAICYKAIGSFQNAQCHLLNFLDSITDVRQPNSKELNRAEWYYYKEEGYCCNQLGQWESASIDYEMAVSLLDLYNIHCLSIGRVGKKADFLHSILVQALNAFEKENNEVMATGVIDYALHYFPNDAYYKAIKQRLDAASAPKDAASQLLTQVFQPELHPCLQHAYPAPTIEKGIEQYIVSRIERKNKVFKKQVSIYETNEVYGQQLYVHGAGCFIDLLLEEYNTRNYYAVMIANADSASNKLHQLEHACEALSLELGRKIKGILYLYEGGSIDREELALLDNIEVYKLNTAFNQLS